MTGQRWARSPHDGQSHLLAETSGGAFGVVVARCGHSLPTTLHTEEVPSGGAICADCTAISVGLPRFTT